MCFLRTSSDVFLTQAQNTTVNMDVSGLQWCLMCLWKQWPRNFHPLHVSLLFVTIHECTLQWISQQWLMIGPCSHLLNVLPDANESISDIKTRNSIRVSAIIVIFIITKQGRWFSLHIIHPLFWWECNVEVTHDFELTVESMVMQHSSTALDIIVKLQ